MDFKSIVDTLKNFIEKSISYDAKASAEEIHRKKRNIMICLVAVVTAMVFIFVGIFFSFRSSSNVVADKNKEVIYVRVVPGMGSDAIGKMLVELLFYLIHI